MNPHILGDPATDYLYAGTNQDPPVDYAWYNGHMTHPVGQKLPNELGIFDMSGNVWERVWDWYPSEGNYSVYPGTSGATDPTGPASGSLRLVRGGSWVSPVGCMRVSVRSGATPGNQFYDLGLRLVRTAVKGEKRRA